MIKESKVSILGFDIDVCNYGYATYLYPSFNGNFEVRANHKGFRQLHHYLRMVKWIQKTGKKIRAI